VGVSLLALTAASIVLSGIGYSSAFNAHNALLAQTLPVNEPQRQGLESQAVTGNAEGVTGIVFVPLTLIPGIIVLATGPH
jgi:hypothetical protein